MADRTLQIIVGMIGLEKIASGIMDAAGDFLEFGLDANQGFENATMGIESAIKAQTGLARGSEELTKKTGNLVQGLKDLAVISPFSTLEVEDAAKKMMNMGIAYDEVIPLATKFGDVIAASGGTTQNFTGALRQFEQGMGKGKFSMQDFNSMVENGFPIWEMLHKHTGLSIEELRAMQSGGSLTTAMVKESILAYTDMDGTMKAMAGTSSGLKNSLGDLAQLAAAELTKPIFDTWKEGMQWLANWMQTAEFKNGIKEIAAVVSSFIETNLPPLLARLKEVFGFIKENAGPALERLSTTFSEVATWISSVANTYGPPLLTLFRELGTYLINNAGPALSSIKDFIGGISASANEFAEKYGPVTIKIFQAFARDMRETVGPAMVMINDAIDRISRALEIQGGSGGKVDIVVVALAGLKIGLDVVVTAFKALAIGMQAAADVVERVKRVVDSVRDAMDGIKRAIDNVIDGWRRFGDAARQAAAQVPDWMIPHSPTKFEVGLRGIAEAQQRVNSNMGNMGGGMAQSMPTGGMGAGATIILNFNSPVLSLTDQYSMQQWLMPAVQQGVRAAMEGRA